MRHVFRYVTPNYWIEIENDRTRVHDNQRGVTIEAPAALFRILPDDTLEMLPCEYVGPVTTTWTVS